MPKIIAVSKTFPIENVLPLVEHGHLHYGENKVQEALDKWNNVKDQNKSIKIHLIGRLQTNKVKHALKIFDYIHKFCKNLNLNIIGKMCIPPNHEKAENYFFEMNRINKELNFNDLSMGMSGDYLDAIRNNATYVRIGSKIFGSRD